MLNKIFKAICSPFQFMYNLKFPDRFIRFCAKKKYMVILISILVTIICLFLVYFNNISELVK